MIPWIQVYSNLITHPKTSRLADLLKLSSKVTTPDVVATGLLVSLWTWAIQNTYDGDLSGCSDRVIAEAARYRKNPQVFVEALMEAGWLEKDKRIHNWDHYALLLIQKEENRRTKTTERVRRYRNKKEAESNASIGSLKTGRHTQPTPSGAVTNSACNAPVTVTDTVCNAPTIPNHTIPNNIDANNTVHWVGATQSPDCARFNSRLFSVFWETYPLKYGKKDGREAAWEAWKKLAPSDEDAARIIDSLKAWKLSGEWTDDGDRYIPKAAVFLSRESYRSVAPPPGKQYRIPKGASGELGEAELEAIRRVLQEGNSEAPDRMAGDPE